MKLVSQAALAAAALGLGTLGASAQTLEPIRYGTNWFAQAEHGGYYQAVADGTYAACGLDVEIVQGGPQANNRMLLPVGRIEAMAERLARSIARIRSNLSKSPARS
jgi:NitT/TauT family transport system substrate-binding protein